MMKLSIPNYINYLCVLLLILLVFYHSDFNHVSSDSVHISVPAKDLVESNPFYIAIQYHGTVRTFAQAFRSQIVNLMASSPYPIHIYIHLTDIPDKTRSSTRPIMFNSTIQFFDSYKNLEGEWINIESLIKGFQLETKSEQHLDEYYAEYANYMKTMPGIDQFWSASATLYAAEKVNKMRMDYELNHRINYKWVIRVRYDQIIRTNIWQQIFYIVPYETFRTNSLALKAINSLESELQQMIYDGKTKKLNELNPTESKLNYPFRYGGLLFIHRIIPNDKTIYIPPCEDYGGYADNFALGTPYVMNIYHTRISPTNALIKDYIFHKRTINYFHAQTWNKEILDLYSITRVFFPICYGILRVSPSTQLDLRLVPTRCFLTDYGNDCCKNICGENEQLRINMIENMKSVKDPLVLDNYYGLLYGSLPADYTSPTQLPCLRPQPYYVTDPYQYHPLHFIHENGEYYMDYIRDGTCNLDCQRSGGC